MKLNLKYFGHLTDITNCKEESFDFSRSTISELLEDLYTKYPDLRQKDFQVAQNKEFVTLETEVISEEIALLPPFSGG